MTSLQSSEVASAAASEEHMTVSTVRGDITLRVVSQFERSRANSYLTKEPETIEWIDGFASADVFWDIGANVGVYTLYAAVGVGCRTLAFEPALHNFGSLLHNLEINGALGRATPLLIAFSARTGLLPLHHEKVIPGAARVAIGRAIDHRDEPFEPRRTLDVTAFTVDDFLSIFNPPFPNHIKLDVDGVEADILEGAATTLADGRLRSLVVELDDHQPCKRDRILRACENAGLTFAEKRHAPIYDGTDLESYYNYRFVR